MPPPVRHLLFALAFVGLYWVGGVFGNQLIVGQDAVVLLWPPGALSFALLLHRGRRWWPLIAASDLVFSLTGTSVPAVFIPFTMAANTLAAFAGTTIVRAVGGLEVQRFDFRALRAMALGALGFAFVTTAFGVTGLVLAGFTTVEGAPVAAATWFISNIFGVLVIVPALALLFAKGTGEGGGPRRRLGESATWLACLLGALLVVATVDGESVRNALATLALPTTVLLWGAMRVPSKWLASGTLATGLGLAVVAAREEGAVLRPSSTFEAFLLLLLLVTLAVAPLLVGAAVREIRRKSRESLALARTDPLTGLANRQGLEHAVSRLLAEGPVGAPLCVAFIDIDNFTLANDAGGQAAGDAFLRSIASVIRAEAGEQAVLGRLSGDQFVLALENIGPGDTEALLRSITAAVREYRHAVGDSVISTTASIGGVGFRRGQVDYAEALRLADAACATVKDIGGNRVQLTPYEEAAQAVEQRSETLRWAAKLDAAIREDHFSLFCQSSVPLQAAHGTRRHFEILLRMVDPRSGKLVLPSRFVHAAEKFKLGPRLDRHVVDMTLDWLERNPRALEQVELCAINLCAASVNDPGFTEFLKHRFAGSNVDPSRICLEITETSAVRDLNDAQQFISSAKALGLKLALDDFGAGFCSFAYLRRLDVDYFKIDGSFVKDLESSPLSLSIVRSISNIARSIDKLTIAEFVEDDAVRLRLSQLGVDFGQGYGFDRPCPIDRYFLRPAPGGVSPPSIATGTG